MEDKQPQPVRPDFPDRQPTREDIQMFERHIMSPGELHEQMDKAMDWAIHELESNEPTEIVTPTMWVFVRMSDGTHRMDWCALFVPDDAVSNTVLAMGRKYRKDKEFVSGLLHFSEMWMSSSPNPHPRMQPKLDPNRKEGLQVTACTMTGGIMGKHMVFERDPVTKKAIVDRSKIEVLNAAQVPRMFRLFMTGYAEGEK